MSNNWVTFVFEKSYLKSDITQTIAIGTVAKSLSKNKTILLNCLILNRYIRILDLRKHFARKEQR